MNCKKKNRLIISFSTCKIYCGVRNRENAVYKIDGAMNWWQNIAASVASPSHLPQEFVMWW